MSICSLPTTWYSRAHGKRRIRTIYTILVSDSHLILHTFPSINRTVCCCCCFEYWHMGSTNLVITTIAWISEMNVHFSHTICSTIQSHGDTRIRVSVCSTYWHCWIKPIISTKYSLVLRICFKMKKVAATCITISRTADNDAIRHITTVERVRAIIKKIIKTYRLAIFNVEPTHHSCR